MIESISMMVKLVQAILLHSRTRRFSSLLSCRQMCSKTGKWPVLHIYSKTGKWPIDRVLTPEVKREAEDYWKNKYSKEKDDPHVWYPENNLEKNDYEEKDIPPVSSQVAKKYVLSMFPYPSGSLHMGHVRVYSISDAMARFYRLRGFQVIHPMGWDAFGLPAENAAIENNIPPDEWTCTNIAQMKSQLLDLGCKFDWDKEFRTCDPTYYKWTQYIFLLLYNAGLAYQQEAQVNWDPIDQTVLANEQVDSEGRSWRSGALVEKKYLKQWFIRTTRYSQSLRDGLDDPILEFWQDIPKIQKHWIGECNGYRVEMRVTHHDNSISDKLSSCALHLWMEFPELLHGISFIGIRTDHMLNTNEYFERKSGIYQMLNVKAVCPLSQRKIPIIVCDKFHFYPNCYVGIACINDRANAIAKEFQIKTVEVLNGEDNDFLTNSGDLNGLRRVDARIEVAQDLLKCRSGGYRTSSNLQDWLISRQRYWGTPIPMIHCPSCGTIPVPFDQLPVELPKITESFPKGKSPLKDNEEWRVCPCPRCGGSAERETDTMDTFADSSWYFLRFLDSQNVEKPFDFMKQELGMPVDLYIGGKEHAEVHMYFARFIQHFLLSEGLVSHSEPFKRLLVQGMVLGLSYKVQNTGIYLKKEEVDFSVDPPVELGTGAALDINFEKMSKSKYNGVDPQDVLKQYGTDTTRLFMLANYAPFSPRNWSEETFPGIIGWQNRIWLTVSDLFQEWQKKQEGVVPQLSDHEIKKHRESLWLSRNRAVQKTTFNMQETHQLSTAISFMQQLTVALRKVPKEMMLDEEFELGLAAQIIMIAPITPHFASELWAGFCSVASSPKIRKELPLLQQSWPEVDQNYEIPIKIVFLPFNVTRMMNLKRSVMDSLNETTLMEAMMCDKDFKKYLERKQIIGVQFKISPGVGGRINITAKKKENEEHNKNELREKKEREMGLEKGRLKGELD